MRQKLNCWEFRNCGMEPGGIFAKIHGVCAIPQLMKLDGVNDGRGAGRACWMVMNSPPGEVIFCRSSRQSCCLCEFYRRVHNEEEISIPDEILVFPEIFNNSEHY